MAYIGFVIILLIASFFIPVLTVGLHWILRDKSPYISRTFLTIRVGFSYAKVWMVSIVPLLSNSPSFFSRFFETVSNAATTIIRKFISKETNIVLKIYKTLIRPHKEYFTQSWASVLRHGKWRVMLRLEGK